MDPLNELLRNIKLLLGQGLRISETIIFLIININMCNYKQIIVK